MRGSPVKPVVFSTRVDSGLGAWVITHAAVQGVKRTVVIERALRAYRAAHAPKPRQLDVVGAVGETLSVWDRSS